jgi:hypothetical protein
VALQEELNNFTRNEVRYLVPRPNQNVVGTKWVFRNKQDEHGVVTRNKARLVAKGYSQVKGLEFDETYALVAMLESIRILLAYATYHGFKLYQMYMKSAFLNGHIKEEVYVEQPPGFEDSEYPSHVYKLSKALYGLKQAPRAWYECLRDFLITNGFKVGKAYPNLFTKMIAKDLFICQIYVDDIIFGSTNKSSCEEFSSIMIQKFEMSMMGELKYFLRFQIKQLQEGTFICQTKYIQDILKKFGMKNAKPIKLPMGTNGHLDLDTGGKSVDQKVYRSMIGSLLYLCASQPDIMLSVCMCARFQENPKEVHLRVVKRIMRYLVSVFRPRGVPGPTSQLSLRVPVQMGRRETEHKGENSKWKPRPRVVLRPGWMRLQYGVTSVREGEREREPCASLVLPRGHLLVRGPWTFLL